MSHGEAVSVNLITGITLNQTAQYCYSAEQSEGHCALLTGNQ